MKEICQVIICKKGNKNIGVITGLGNFLSFDPLMLLTDVYETDGDFEVWDYNQTNKYNMQKLLHFTKEEKMQYNALIKGIKYLIEQSYISSLSISPSSVELLRPYYEITLKFTPIGKVSDFSKGTSSHPPIYYESFAIDKLLGGGLHCIMTIFINALVLLILSFPFYIFFLLKSNLISASTVANISQQIV
ncbi:MAG TPA: hypothetical protein DCE48_12295 [Lachnospiraceae bacterium]|uniref:hypothetical protein n=1 Tax=Anaerosporobacter sp. TaxID=1872529 RepID=UPI000EE66099|nr:hypothetical protein [Anaerosporobacter sp.]HAB61450.1 hypothetical protein [Lachnospiraceae bacterium]